MYLTAEEASAKLTTSNFPEVINELIIEVFSNDIDTVTSGGERWSNNFRQGYFVK